MQQAYTPAYPVRVAGIPADLLTHPGRAAIIDYVQQHMDAGAYFLSETGDGERGIITYRLTLHKGHYVPSKSCEYSLFDSINLITERTRVSRATAKQTHDHICTQYNHYEQHIAALKAAADQWQAQKREPGQVRFDADTYHVHIGRGYDAVYHITDKNVTLKRVPETYQPNELGAYTGTIHAYKWQEYHNKDADGTDLAAVLETWSAKTDDQLAATIEVQEAQARKAKEERRAQYAREQEEKRKAEEEARAKVNTGGSKYVLLRYNYKDDSDIMTDYFSTKLDTVDVLLETDTPIRSTFAGGRMDIWRLLRSKGIHIDGLKYKHYGGIMSLVNKRYTGSGAFTAVVFAEREKVMRDQYTVAALARGMQAA